MSYANNIPFSGKTPRDLARRWLALSRSLLGLTLLIGCSQGPPNPANVPEAKPQATDNELHFDERYLDSLDEPRSARAQREMAILWQLKRLKMVRRSTYDPTAPNDSVFDQPVAGSPLVGYLNDSAQLIDIYRRIDSLKVLENIPITPHK
jgi:hypothetical protein